MATFNNSGAYSILNTQKGTYYVQGGHYFAPATFVDLGTTTPTDYQSLSSERSDAVNISGGSLNGVTIGAGSTISAPISGPITGATITGGTINGTPIGNTTPASGAFTTLNATSTNILGPSAAQGVNSTTNSQVASTTNTGAVLSASSNWASTTYYDSTRGADAKTADVVWESGALSMRFKNDAGSAATTWLQATGAYNALTGITSNSGSGVWAHTGSLTVTNYVGSLDTGSLPGFSGSSGAFLYAGNGFESLMLQRIGNTAGDRRAYVGFSGSGVAMGFFNDQSGTQTPAITVAGGAASGISGITSSSGSGSWAHTGAFSASGAINSSVGLTVKEGANAKQGVATLVAGTVTVSNTSVTANSRILLTVQSLGTVTAPKAVAVTARTAATSFTITSADNTDTSVVAYEIFEPGA
jgi:hypothetical protein